MHKRAHWIVYMTHTPARDAYLSPIEGMQFYYLEYDSRNGYYKWTADVKQACRFTRPKALKLAHDRGAAIDFHPDFRYGE
jgi:hypothetical protein